jgi:hypothetical protein
MIKRKPIAIKDVHLGIEGRNGEGGEKGRSEQGRRKRKLEKRRMG